MIEVNDLTFRYTPDSPDVLKGIGFRVAAGSFTAIMGSNGSGKSTLARCLSGLLVPNIGYVKVDGTRTDNTAARRDVRRKVGLVLQDPNLQMTSVTIERELAFGLENISTASQEMKSRVNDFLQLFHFEDRRHDPPSSLSGGERQQLAIASIMILEPAYLILDEATSLLAARSRTAVLDMVLQLHRQRNVAVLLITQYPSEALLGERLLVLHKGNIMFDDKPDKVFQHCEALIGMGVSVPMRERLSVAV